MLPDTSTKDRAFAPRARVESVDVRTLLLAGISLAALLSPQGAQPINTMCPVKPKQKAKASITVSYEGQLIGFC